MKKILAFTLVFTILLNCCVFANENTDTYFESINNAEIRTGSINGEWLILAIARGEKNIKFDEYYSDLCNTLTVNNGDLDRKYTAYSRVIIALTAMGKDPSNVAGYNLLDRISDYDKVTNQGLNGAIFAIIATKCGGYKNFQCENYLSLLLNRQNADGSFSLNGDGDIDITAMALQALSFYSYRENVNNSIEKALSWLKGKEADNVESYAQMLVAYTSLKSVEKAEIDRVYNRVMSFAIEGGFCHKAGEVLNQMASEQACYSIIAYERYLQGETSLFNINNNKEIFLKVG